MKVSSIGCCYFSVIFQDQGLILASGFYIFPKIFIFWKYLAKISHNLIAPNFHSLDTFYDFIPKFMQKFEILTTDIISHK